jgi:hypothetical protein
MWSVLFFVTNLQDFSFPVACNLSTADHGLWNGIINVEVFSVDCEPNCYSIKLWSVDWELIVD